jgi:hypothetical protein
MPDGGVITPGVPAARPDRGFARYEVLHEPADLVRRAAESRLPAGLEPVVSAEELAAARTLRDALWRLTADGAHGRELRRADLAVVNEAAVQAPHAPRITADGGTRRRRRTMTAGRPGRGPRGPFTSGRCSPIRPPDSRVLAGGSAARWAVGPQWAPAHPVRTRRWCRGPGPSPVRRPTATAPSGGASG